jgi:hypothetical protein
LATRSVFYPDTEQVMGWDIGASGFKIILSAQVPQVVDQHMRGDVDALPRRPGPQPRADITQRGSATPAGPRCSMAFERRRWRSSRAEATALTWRLPVQRGGQPVLAPACSSCCTTPCASVRPPPGTLGLMLLAMGPGLLLRAPPAAVLSVGPQLRAPALLLGLLAPALALAAPPGAPLSPEWSVPLFGGWMRLTVVERLVEVVVSLRNAAWSYARGRPSSTGA